MENIGKSIKKVSQRLRSGAGAPDFWALVRALENANPENPRLGHAKNPKDENVRFGQAPFLHFPPTDIAEIISAGMPAGVDAAIIVYFFGLLGVNGPMPLEFTNYVFRRSHSGYDNTWRRFLDIIHHRFLTLYYRAYSAGQQAISADRREDDPFADIVQSLAGFAPNGGFREEQEKFILQPAQHFSFPMKNRWGLEDMLRRIFQFNLEVREFIPASYDIPPQSYALLGAQSSTLGVDLQIGRTYMCITGKFEIHIGPLSFTEYMQFMDSQYDLKFLSSIIALYLDRPLDYSVVFTIRRDTIPLAQLGFDMEKGRWEAPMLGYTCWIGNPEDRFATLDIASARFKVTAMQGEITHG